MITHASTFSGIGGPEIAASMLGWENVFHCEIQDFPRRVLQYHYPNAKSYEDITKTDFSEWRGKVTVLSGGFPCQPFSYAGQRRGSEDDRYLWPYMLRCIEQVRPAWFVGENVAGITTMALPGKDAEVGSQANIFGQTIHMERREQYVLHAICQQLQDIGYSVQPIVVPACAVGAPHRRDRIFIVANDLSYTSGIGHGGSASEERGAQGRTLEQDKRQGSALGSEAQGCGRGLHGEYAQGADAHAAHSGYRAPQEGGGSESRRSDGFPQPGEWRDTAQRHNGLSEVHGDAAGNIPNAHIEGLEGMHNARSEEEGRADIRRDPAGHCGEDIRHAEGLQCDGRHLHREHREKPKSELGGADLQSMLPENRWREFPSVPYVHRGNDGLPFDVDRLAISFPKWRNESLKAYGNAIVPQVIYMIYEAIDKIEKGLILPD